MRASEAVSKANSERGQIPTFLETKKVEMITETSSSESEFNVEEICNETAEKSKTQLFQSLKKMAKYQPKTPEVDMTKSVKTTYGSRVGRNY